MQVVVQTVNLVRARGLDHRQLTVFSVIRHFLIYVGKLKTLCANNHFLISMNFVHKSEENSWKLSTLMTRVSYSDYIGPARLRLNLPKVALELKQVWHPGNK